MKLFEIDKSIRAFWDKIMEQDGELTEEDIKTFDELEVAKNDKLKAYGVIIRELNTDINDCKENIDRLKAISDKLKNRQEWLKTRLKEFMLNNDITKYESTEVNISFRRSQCLTDGDINTLPEEFIKIEKKADKSAIKNYIKNGGVIDGWYLQDNQNIQIK